MWINMRLCHDNYFAHQIFVCTCGSLLQMQFAWSSIKLAVRQIWHWVIVHAHNQKKHSKGLLFRSVKLARCIWNQCFVFRFFYVGKNKQQTPLLGVKYSYHETEVQWLKSIWHTSLKRCQLKEINPQLLHSSVSPIYNYKHQNEARL